MLGLVGTPCQVARAPLTGRAGSGCAFAVLSPQRGPTMLGRPMQKVAQFAQFKTCRFGGLSRMDVRTYALKGCYVASTDYVVF